MTKHAAVLAMLIEALSREHPGCGVLVWGSVMEGREHPDSDLDMFVVVDGGGPIRLDQGWQNGKRQAQNYFGGVCLDKTTMPAETLARALRDEPYVFWFFARSRIVHDPAGIAGRLQGMARAYFDAHPEVESVWRENSARHHEVKARLRADPQCGLQPPQWDQVADLARQAAGKIRGAQG